jgi:hypothetical protein
MVPYTVHGQDEKMKAIFVYNFTRYIGWPEKPGNFIILILGKSPISAELTDVALKKKVGNSTIEVRNINSFQEVSDCHIVYVTSSKTDQLASILSLSGKKNILIITEKDGACKNGAGINFVNLNGKLTFEISKTNMVKSGLTVSSVLYGLGTVISE